MVNVSLSNDKLPQFFKVFIPKFSSKHMLIPPDFVQRFISRVPKKVIIRHTNGKCWVVALGMSLEKDLYFENGWEEFVRDQMLNYGDSLVFKYHGHSLFEVDIFGQNGCMKGIGVPSKMMGKKEEETLKKEELLDSYMHAHNEEISINGSTKKSSSSTKHVPMKKNPCFVATIGNSKIHSYMLYIPQPVHNGVKFKPNTKLRYHNGKLWPVRISNWKDGRCFLTAGWRRFREENDLKANDKYVFELVLAKENECEEIKVTCQSKVQ
ncbi:hypothetical protein F8388_025236 [Cannabis sativa]|uniref:TF-B3 domain-containing protein n=1 Tax=Cannabis sativa TaxID=3483 RepID=A0A7J6FSC9_CANSA|nr:hypothetical protein F8388_025236 [Cannabis sativa]